MTNRHRPRPVPQLTSHLDDGVRDEAFLADATEVPVDQQVARLARKYIWLALPLILAGGIVGVASVVYSSPIYKVRTMLEIQGINEAFLRNSFEVASNYDSTQLNIQTQITLLRSGPFLQRVKERLQAETVPSPPEQGDFFSKIRRRIRADVQDPLQIMKDGLESAFRSFDARPINGTRLIEISCDSTSPQMAAQFLNAMSGEFIEETMRSRSMGSQKTGEWLTSQMEETKIKLQAAEQRLQDFVRNSGSMFASRDGTLDDSKLKQLQTELASIQADRIAKQARYEMAMKSAPESLPEILENDVLRNYQTQLLELRRQKAALETTLTSKNPKVLKLDAQIEVLQGNIKSETDSMLGRIKNEYSSAMNRERLLSAAYYSQLGRVSSIAGKSADFNSIQREVDTLRQMYQGLVAQSNQSSVNNSVPINPIRLVEPASPPRAPYKPRPSVNIGFGCIGGLFVAVGIAFLREKTDRSVRHPRASQILFNVPQLGVIPSATLLDSVWLTRLLKPSTQRRLPGDVQPIVKSSRGLAAWEEGPSFIAESFRTTLASLLRDLGSSDGKPSVIAVTSPGPGEGKTTIASNLAMALAETGRRVLLVDADFRRPAVHDMFGVPNPRGFVDLLTGPTPPTEEEIEKLLTITSVPGLMLIVNRPLLQNVSKVFYSAHLQTTLERLGKGFDVVLLDTPPLLHLADTRLIAPLADGVILVIRSGVTDKENALEACAQLQDDGLKILGTVLNDWNPGGAMKRHYYYDYSTGKGR